MPKKVYKAILADLDGTIYRGRTLIPGAAQVYSFLSKKGIRWFFLSNNAGRLASDIAEGIRKLGMPISDDQVINSASALLNAISKHYRGSKVLVIGHSKLIASIEASGASITEDPTETDIVVVALDTNFTYDKLKRAHIAIQRGSLFWASNLDPSFPVENGFLPGAGSIVAAVATASGKQPDRVFGKPSPEMAALVLEKFKLSPKECLVVGDRMDTDILFAKNAGADSALVLTGVTQPNAQEYEASHRPQYVFDSIADLTQLF